MGLSIESKEEKPGTLLAALKGELILGTDCNKLAQFVQAQADRSQHLVFDVAGVSQIDSTGIGLFIDAYSRLEKAGGRMTIAGAAGAVKDAFHVTRLDTVFRFVATTDAA